MAARALAVLFVVAVATHASAQPAPRAAPCAVCDRGSELIRRLGLELLRNFVDRLAHLELSEPLSAEQYASVVKLRDELPATIHLGGLDDADFVPVAASLCGAAKGPCNDATAHALRCLADRCEVTLPPADPKHVDLPELPAACRDAPRKPAAFGLGVDWGNGWQRSRYPSDGRAWSLGVEGRLRFGPHLGAVARVDRIAGRDEGTDADGNGKDDFSTGSITRIAALGGPSLVFDAARFEDSTRLLRLDLLGGYIATQSQARESGPAAGIDLALEMWVFRLGVRVVQGFGDARDATMVLGHVGFVAGNRPTFGGNDCEGRAPKRSSRAAIGFDFPSAGYGISKQLGWTAPGLGVELLYHLSPRFDALARADMLVFPGDERDRVIHQDVLAGLRIDHGPRRGRSEEVGFFSTVAGGYTHSAGLTGATTGSGPVVDLSVGWGLKASDGAAYIRLHGRFGASEDNLDYRVIFLSGGFELHFDRDHWRRS